jgi:hypothetical protein
VSGTDFSGATSANLSIIANATTYNGYKFRLVATGAGSCGSTTSDVVTLTAYPKPTAAFDAGAIVCGVGTYNLRINFTGTGPWSFTYTTNGGSAATVSNIAANPFYLAVSPSVTTTYAITALNDRYCANYSVSSPVTIVVQAKPTITLTSSSINYCYNASAGNATLAYSGTTQSPDQYSITAGSRAMPSFAAISNASNAFNSGSGNISVAIPAGTAAGTYDFNLKVKKSTPAPGCESETVAFTVVVLPAPPLTVTSSVSSVCSGGSVTLTASPDLSAASPAHTYAWTGGTVANSTAVSTSATVTAPTTYTVTVTNSSNGCTASGSVSITLKAGLTVTVNNATICPGDKAVLTASGATTYSWALSSGGSASSTLSSTTGSTVLANPTATEIYRVTGSSATGCPGTADATVTVSSGLGLMLSNSISICPGSPTTLTASASGSPTFSWAPASSLSSGSGASVTATPAATTTYTVTATSGSCTETGTITLTVSSSPVTAAPPRNLVFCNGDLNGSNEIKLTVNSSSSVAVIWEYLVGSTWTAITSVATNDPRYRNNVVGSTALSNILTLSNSAYTSTTELKYRAGVISGSCTTYYYTDLVNLTTTTPVFSASGVQSICSGTAPTAITSDITYTNGTSSKNYTAVYQWQSSTDGTTFTDISGATSATYQPPSLTSDRWYRVGVKASSGSQCDATFKYSSSAKVTVVASISGNTISGTDCPSGPATLTGSAITGGTYLWQSSTNGSSWSDIPGATGQNYTAATLLTQKTWFRRQVTVSSCTDVSSSVTLTPAVLGAEISSSQTLCLGASANTLGPVSPTGGEGVYTYQWKESANGSTFSNVASGGTSSSYTPVVSAAGTKYYQIVVTSGTCSATSNSSIVTVNALPTVTVSPANTGPVCSGTNLTLTASGASTYTWSPSTYLDVTSGAVVKSIPTGNITYTATGTDANGCVNSGTRTVNVSALPTAPTSNGTSTYTACNPPTNSVSLNSIFISGSATAPEEYRWYTENTNPPVISPVANPTSTSTNGTYYAFTYNTSTGCYSSSSISATLNLKQNTQPVPLALSYSACSPATFNLQSNEPTAPSGTTWEWQTGSTYNTGNAVNTPTSVGSGTYYLYGRNSTCTTAASASVAVTINSLPLSSVTVSTEQTCSPNKVDISDNYTNTGDIYQWYTVNSNPTPATLVSDPTQVSAGTYYLFVTRATTLCQSSSPATATVTINSPPTVSITTPSLICEGTSVNIVSSVSSGSPTYQWYSVNTASNTVSTLSGSPYSNETTNTLTVNPTSGLSSYLFYVTATLSGCSASSSMVPIPMSTVVSCTSQPINSFVSTLPNGTYFSFSVDDFNANIQWQRSKDGGTTWRNLDTAKSYDKAIYYGIYTARLDILSVHDSMNNYKYRAIATTSPCSGGCTTSIATLTTPVSLPVSGMKLTGAKSGDQLELKWYVMSEEDVEYYVVMFAENGQDFTSIGKVWVPNPSFTAKSYSYGVPAKKGYYKIQAVAERHAPVFSNVFWYQSGDAIKTGINPNPVQADKGSLLLSVSGVDHELPFKVNVHGVDGRLIQSAEMKMQSGTHVFQLNENALSGSLVILSIVHPDLGVIQRKKVIIQH